jgi:hypothetical protein
VREVVVFARITRLEAQALRALAKQRKTDRSKLIREAICRVIAEAA